MESIIDVIVRYVVFFFLLSRPIMKVVEYETLCHAK